MKIESFSGKSVRFRHPLLPEIHVVQKKFREGTVMTIESFSGKSVRFRHPQLPEIHCLDKGIFVCLMIWYYCI